MIPHLYMLLLAGLCANTRKDHEIVLHSEKAAKKGCTRRRSLTNMSAA